MTDVTKQPSQQKEELWRKRLAAQAASGMSIAQWCRQAGCSGSLFHYWKHALTGRDGRRPTPPRARSVANSEARPGEPAFAQVVIAPPGAKRQLATSAAGEPAIEIVVSGSRVVRVGVGFDAATLTRVLAVLEGCSC
jgi:hypothetical protein